MAAWMQKLVILRSLQNGCRASALFHSRFAGIVNFVTQINRGNIRPLPFFMQCTELFLFLCDHKQHGVIRWISAADVRRPTGHPHEIKGYPRAMPSDQIQGIP